MSDDGMKEIEDAVAKVPNIFQIKMTSGEEIITRISLTPNFKMGAEDMLIQKVVYARWAMLISTITQLEDSETERVDYIFKPWMQLQDDIDKTISIRVDSIQAVYDPHVLVKAQYLEMVDKYHQYTKALEEGTSNDKTERPVSSSTSKVINMFNRDSVDPDQIH